MRFFFPILIFLLGPACLFGQHKVSNEGKGLLFSVSYGYQLPGADLKSRFGGNLNAGLGMDYIMDDSNWIIGFEGNFLFGQRVKADVLSQLRTEEGYIIGTDRLPADVSLRERGFYAGVHVARIIALSKSNVRSGLRVSLGGGLLQHMIRIQEDPSQEVAQLLGDYQKGYDHLSNGFALKQFIAYQHLDKNKAINFYAGFDLCQAFTQNRREVNFDTQMKEEGKRLDLLFGFKLGWILPFYLNRSGEEIIY